MASHLVKYGLWKDLFILLLQKVVGGGVIKGGGWHLEIKTV